MGAFGEIDQGVDGAVIAGVEKERDRIAVGAFHRHHPMQGGPVTVIGPDLHHVADVDHKSAFERRHIVPQPVLKHLQTADLILHQDGQGATVGMVMDAEIGAVAGAFRQVRQRILDRIVIQPQKTGVAAGEIPVEPVGR
ncbi:MAG: hypothetical protein VXX53_04645 [Pseudomonadota bacterium]|nr:hypothetical protein [Pseudomonadota bacterium]